MFSESAARVKLPVSTTRVKARIAMSWSIFFSRLFLFVNSHFHFCWFFTNPARANVSPAQAKTRNANPTKGK
ncbi:hypothetical protein [Enterobacter cloacae]|uniref:hypothetical protein n=1 Tax=Enterobacter cloacae TaxID=550 RepID=UPI003204F91F